MRKPLSNEQIEDALSSLAGWKHEHGKLKKTFTFGNFREAISFIVQLAFSAEQHDHHPELFNVYNKVEIELTTHNAGNCVTQKDLQLAMAIEAI